MIWWIVFLAILPFYHCTVVDAKRGYVRGVPENPRLKTKVMITTLVTGVIWGTIYLLVEKNIIKLEEWLNT